MSSIPLPNNVSKITMTGNLDLYGNLNLNSQNVYLGYLAGNTNVANVNDMKNVAIGASCATYQTGLNNVSIGYDAATNGTTTYTGANNVSIGYNSGFNSGFASTSNGVAIGVNSLIDFSGSIAIGSSATARGFRNVAIGSSSTSNGTVSVGNSIAIGVGANTGSYGNSVAIGLGAVSTANNQITLGTTNDKLAFVGMRGNYFFVSDAGYTQTVGTPSNNIVFRTTVDSCSLLEKQTDNYTFKNVSGRPIICIATFSICIDYGTSQTYTAAYFLYNGVRYGSFIVYSPQITNIGTRISTTAILRLDINETFVCQVIPSGGTTSSSSTLTTTLSVVIF